MDYKDFAVGIAKEAGQIALKHFKAGVVREWKSNDTPITEADREINQFVIDEIQKAFPDHSIVAEEGSAEKKSDYVWVCDPIDGTTPFSATIPTFAFSLALTKHGESVLGVALDPFLERLMVAEKGKGAFMGKEKLQVSNTKTLKNAYMCLDTDERLIGLREILIKEHWAFTLSPYSGVYGGMLVALGQTVAEIFEYPNPWDAAAIKIIVEEAGGKVTDILGNEQRYDKKTNGFLATNGHVHEKLLKLIKESLKN